MFKEIVCEKWNFEAKTIVFILKPNNLSQDWKYDFPV